jgi:hypothetical protein
MADLRRLLLHADEAQRGRLERLLPYSFCLPREATPLKLANAIRARVGVHAIEPGQTPLVAVAGERASLWLLEPRADEVEFIGAARASLKLAEQRVSRDLPLLFEPGALAERWSARRLFTQGEQTLDGSSFGLSFCLAFASLMLAVPLDSHLLASAVVTADGELEGVDEVALGLKLRLIRDWAPGMKTVLVASDNGTYAERVAAELGADFQVVRARSLQAALEIAFPNLVEALEARFDDARKREHAARRLFELVRDGSSSLLSWRGVAASSSWLGARLPAGSEALLEARFAEAVARRHAGEELPCPLEFAWVERMPRPLRLRVIAHLVEHSRFHESHEREAIRELAERELAPRALDDNQEDLSALGALGRSYAVFQEHEAAERCLVRALSGWRQLGLVEHSSFALCEWVRILGLTGRREDLRALLGAIHGGPVAISPPLGGLASELLQSPRATALSRSFVRFSLGRGFQQAEAPLEALHFLEDSPEQSWSLTPVHLQASRLRWLARARCLAGDSARAEVAFAELSALASAHPEAQFAAALAAIDVALEKGKDAASGLERLRQLEPRAVALIERQSAASDAAALARAVATHYPY